MLESIIYVKICGSTCTSQPDDSNVVQGVLTDDKLAGCYVAGVDSGVGRIYMNSCISIIIFSCVTEQIFFCSRLPCAHSDVQA
jgi:hypothetical protein